MVAKKIKKLQRNIEACLRPIKLWRAWWKVIGLGQQELREKVERMNWIGVLFRHLTLKEFSAYDCLPVATNIPIVCIEQGCGNRVCSLGTAFGQVFRMLVVSA